MINSLPTPLVPPSDVESLSTTESEIVKTLLYFDIFSYPLSKKEILKNHGVRVSDFRCFLAALQNLVESGRVKYEGGQYSLSGNNTWVTRKQEGAKVAKKHLKMAYRMSWLLSHFPFVRGISLSGSLSKGYADRTTDIDYFIITARGRLWLCRTLIILFKKIFLLNSKKWLCPNYFIDDTAMEIPDRNVFTATEIVYLYPTFNLQLLQNFRKANSWVADFKPNYGSFQGNEAVRRRFPVIQRGVEWLLKGNVGNRLDDFCYRLTTSFWAKKFSDYNRHEFLHAFRSKKNVSKHHPQNFQKQVLEQLEQRRLKFEQDFGVKLVD